MDKNNIWANSKVLIAEDEETNFLLLAEYFSPTGAKVTRAINGLEVVDLCKNDTYDLILMDIKMPVMTGNDAVKKIRSFNLEIPIIAQTAYAMVGDKEKFMPNGFNDYLSKPITEDDFVKVVGKYLNHTDSE